MRKLYLLLVLFIPILIVYNNESLLEKYPKLDLLNKIVDEFNPFVGKFAINSLDIDEINLILSEKDIAYFQEFIKDRIIESNKTHIAAPLISYNSGLKYRKSELYYNGKKYKAKIRLHGKSSWHFMKSKKSYSIKLDKENLIKGMRRFSLSNLEKQAVSSIVSYKISEFFGFMKVNSYLVKVKINDKSQGVYMLEEKLHKTLLEKNGYPGVDIIKSIDDYDNQYPNMSHEHPFVYDLANTQINRLSEKNIGQLLRYRILYDENTNINHIKKIINKEKFSKVDAMRILFGDSHGISGANQKILYDTSTGTIYPFFRTEGIVMPLQDGGLGLNFDKNIYNFIKGPNMANNILYKRLAQDVEYRTLRNTYLYEIIKSEEKIISVYEKYLKDMLPILSMSRSPNYSSRMLIYNENINFHRVKNNIKIIKRYLEYSKVFIEVLRIKDNNISISLKPDSNVGVLVNKINTNLSPDAVVTVTSENGSSIKLKIKELKGYFNKNNLMIGLDNDLNLKKQEFLFDIVADQLISKFELEFTNKVTGSMVNRKNIYYKFIDIPRDFNFRYLEMDINSFFEKNKSIDFSIYGNNIFLKKGEYILNQNLILPYGYNLIIEKGAKIKLDTGKSIVVYGWIKAIGAKEDPIIISNLKKEEPFGSIGIVGNGQTNNILQYVEIYGGKEAFINGMHFSGALSLYNHREVKILDSVIHHNSADDGINIKNASVLIENNEFYSNAADQIDLDLSSGLVKNNKFIARKLIKDIDNIKIPIDDNGDGMDLSGSKVIIENNNFTKFPDKAISVGEKSFALLIGNNFIGNRSAVTSKDESEVYLFSNKYKDNIFDIEMYQKKSFFKYPSVFNINENYSDIKIKKNTLSHYYKLTNLKNNTIKYNSNEFDIDSAIQELSKQEWLEYE